MRPLLRLRLAHPKDYTGEAKGELSRLISLLEAWSDADFPARQDLIASCHEATSLIRSNKKDQATHFFLGHSNALWRRVLDQQAGHDSTIIQIKPEHIDAWLTPEGRSVEELQVILDD